MAGAIIGTAFAFAGASAVTNLITKAILGNSRGEFKRHNLVMEQLSKARDEYNIARQQRLDYINKTIRDQNHAEQTFSDLDDAMLKYYEVTGNRLPPMRDPPKESDFYNPSRQTKDTGIVLTIGSMAVVGVLLYKYYK